MAGGGSGGSSAPVLAVAQELRTRRECEFLYVGTSSGPEQELVSRMGIPFRPVQTGKLRRYWSWQNLVDLIRIPMGVIQSLAVVAEFRPHLAFAAGGFAAVPPLIAASLFKAPVVIHQQDVEPGLANKILTPFATAVTVTFPSSLAHFPHSKTTVTGNPVRREILSGTLEEASRLFGLSKELPVVLVTGGGTGALGLNRLVASAARQLISNCQILHITGKGKRVELPDPVPNYQQREFLAEGMGHALAAADLVVSRAGLSTLTELAALGKPSILIPMPRSHQNANADVFLKTRASLVLQESELDGAKLAETILSLLQDREMLRVMSERARAVMPPFAESRIADVIEQVVR